MMEDVFWQSISYVFCFFFYPSLVFQDQPFRIDQQKVLRSEFLLQKKTMESWKGGPRIQVFLMGWHNPHELGEITPITHLCSAFFPGPHGASFITGRGPPWILVSLISSNRTGVEPERGGTEWRDRGGTSTTKGTTEQRNSEPWLVVGVFRPFFTPIIGGRIFLFFCRYFFTFISRGNPEVFGRVWKFCLEFPFVDTGMFSHLVIVMIEIRECIYWVYL